MSDLGLCDNVVTHNGVQFNDAIIDIINNCVIKHENNILACFSGISDDELLGIIKRKNPFIYATYDQSTEQIVREIIASYISESKQTHFGYLLQELAVIICRNNPKWKSTISLVGKKLDIRLTETDNLGRELITLLESKSGPNWGNSHSTSALNTSFNDSVGKEQDAHFVTCVIGHAYSGERVNKTIRDKHGVVKLYGFDYWEFIGGDKFFDSFLGCIKGKMNHEPIDKAQEILVQRAMELIFRKDNEVNYKVWI